MKVLEKVFFQRPRILNALHKVRLADATSQTIERELDALARHATGRQIAVEIGTYQGVSAARIAASLAPDGLLFCVDPWLGGKNGDDPNYRICLRHLHRTGVYRKIRIVRDLSANAAGVVPETIDFAFIDGDHSWDGIQTDWYFVAPRLVLGGVVCLHDTAVPALEPWRTFDSVRFYDEKVASDRAFETIETVYSMRVVLKKS
jgi:predicted O-methyltransferase YrrM